MEDKKKVFISIDWESLGPSYKKNGPNALGMVIFDQNGKELGSYASGIKIEGRVMDEDTKKNFWDDNLKVLEWIEKNSKNPEEVVEDLWTIIKYFSLQGEISWLAYPSSSDWSTMKAFMDEFSTAPFVEHKCLCVSSMLDCYALKEKIDKEEAKKKIGFAAENAHFPDSDARAQGKLYFDLLNYFK